MIAKIIMSGNNLTQLFQSLTINEMSILYIENGHHVTYVKCPITTYVAVAKKVLQGLSSHHYLLMKEVSIQHIQGNGDPTAYLIFISNVPLLGPSIVAMHTYTFY